MKINSRHRLCLDIFSWCRNSLSNRFHSTSVTVALLKTMSAMALHSSQFSILTEHHQILMESLLLDPRLEVKKTTFLCWSLICRHPLLSLETFRIDSFSLENVNSDIVKRLVGPPAPAWTIHLPLTLFFHYTDEQLQPSELIRGALSLFVRFARTHIDLILPLLPQFLDRLDSIFHFQPQNLSLYLYHLRIISFCFHSSRSKDNSNSDDDLKDNFIRYFKSLIFLLRFKSVLKFHVCSFIFNSK